MGKHRSSTRQLNFPLIIAILSLALSVVAISYYFQEGTLVAYGDAESHLNISKRVVSSLTPGLAQLGGIWLPLPHLLMVPFVAVDELWRTGLAGSIVSGLAYVGTSVYLYKLVFLITKHKWASALASLIFMLNPNVLYMQSTAMTEVLLLAFFTISNYCFFQYMREPEKIGPLLLAGAFGFAATLTRYDGWFLVGLQALAILIMYLPKIRDKKIFDRAQGQFLLFSTSAFFGIILWFIWGYLILGDPLYFTNSPFSAKSQQQGWLAKGELPAYHDLGNSFTYYSLTALENVGYILAAAGIIGAALFLMNRAQLKNRLIMLMIMFAPFIFYVVTLYMGQSVIFIPSATPESFEWQLFNVRYGIMMVPVVAFFAAYLFWHFIKSKEVVWKALAFIVPILFATDSYLFFSGKYDVVTYQDATVGLSASSEPDAQLWLAREYDHGLLLMDDYSRTLSVIRSNVPMENVIYIGNEPYWEESLSHPEKYARWIVMQQNDAVWSELLTPPEKQAHLYKYFERTYTSPEIQIFRIKEEYEETLQANLEAQSALVN